MKLTLQIIYQNKKTCLENRPKRKNKRKKSKMTIYSPFILFISLFVYVAAFKLWEKYVLLNPNSGKWSSLKGFLANDSVYFNS